ERQVLLDALEGSFNLSADLGDVGAGDHGGTEQHRLTALVAGLSCWRVFESSAHFGYVAETGRLLPRAQPQLPDLFYGSVPALHTYANRSLVGLDPPRRIHCVLAAERGLDVEPRQPALRQCRR